MFNIAKLQRNDRCMTRWICNTKLSDNISSATILEKLGLVDIDTSLSLNRLRWFGHVSKDTESINEATNLDVVGHRGRERPKKTWADCIKNDRKVWKLSKTNPTDRESWKKALRKLSTVQPPGRGTEAF